MNYEDLLKKAYTSLPQKTESGERFEIPVGEILVQGNRTIIKNFADIADKLRRDKRHLAKYMSKELAAPGNIDGARLILNSKISERSVNEKLKAYVDAFVMCKQCRRPDTKLVEFERGLYVMMCEACGARGSVPKI